MIRPSQSKQIHGLARLVPPEPAQILAHPRSIDADDGQDDRPSRLGVALRRRWRLVLLMWVVVGGSLATFVWTHFENEYEAVGIVRVSPSIPRVLFRDEDSGIVPFYNAFLTTQMQLITSHAVLARALEAPELRNLPWVTSSPDPTAYLAKKLKVDNPSDTQLIQISMEGRNPKELTPVVNGVIKAYMENVVQEDQREELSKLDYLYKKRDDLAAGLKGRHDALSDMANKLGPYSLGTQQDAVSAGTQATQNELKKAQVARAAAEAHLLSLKQQHNSPLSDVDIERIRQEQLAADPELAALDRASVDSERMLVSLTRQLGPNHREVKLMNAQLQDLGRLIQRRQNDVLKSVAAIAEYRGKAAHEAELRKAEQAYGEALEAETALGDVVRKDLDTMSKMGRSVVQLQDLREKAEQDKQLHEAILERIQHIEVEKQRPGRVTIASLASEPTAPSKDKRPKLTLLAFAGALFLAVMTAFMIDLRDTSVRCEEDVRRNVGLAIVGTRTLAELPGQTDETIMASVAEEIRGIRGCVLFAQEANDCRTILITSPNPQEGKTRTAGDLAVALAESGRRVLLIDADNRKRDLTVQFGGDSRPGLSDVLAESHSVSDVLCATSTPGLMFLPTGSLCDTFSELLICPGRFEHLRKVFDDYDLIVVDSPPVLLSNEPGIWARHLDAVLMVLRANCSAREDAVIAKERLSQMGGRIMGVVLNGVDHRSTPYGRYGYAYSNGRA